MRVRPWEPLSLIYYNSNQPSPLINELTDVPVYGPLRYEEELEKDWMKGVKKLSGQAALQELASHLSETGA